MKLHRGSCHCGAVRFEMHSDDILKDIYRCNCSLCQKKGIVMKAEHKFHFRLTAGADNLLCYQWNKNIAEHYFCKTCGVYTHHKRRRDPNQICINVACLDDIDLPADKDIALANGAEHS